MGCVVFSRISFVQKHKSSKASCTMFYYADIPIKTTSDHFRMPAISDLTSRIQSFTVYVHSNSRQVFVCSQNAKLLT